MTIQEKYNFEKEKKKAKAEQFNMKKKLSFQFDSIIILNIMFISPKLQRKKSFLEYNLFLLQKKKIISIPKRVDIVSLNFVNVFNLILVIENTNITRKK